MYMLAFLYPSAPGHRFDVDHWKTVHLPLGLGLTDKYLGIRPRRIILFGPGQGGDLQPDSAPFGAIAAVLFDDRESVERFRRLSELHGRPTGDPDLGSQRRQRHRCNDRELPPRGGQVTSSKIQKGEYLT
jgi:hypothetical protein